MGLNERGPSEKSSDPYPDDDSGGTYYIVPDPPKGFPLVPKYINTTFDTEVVFKR